jgi:cytochrome c oxidase cbb3-type subunit II
MNTNHFWSLVGGLAICFVLPWFFLIVKPFNLEANPAKVSYSAEEREAVGLAEYPDRTTLRFGESDFGAKVYASEGCAYCHTQMVRPTYAGPDMWRTGWGGRETAGLARETRPEDYYGESFAFLGYQRLGQDLSNVGHRITSREEMHRHLYDPKRSDPDSGMPSYIHLYKWSDVLGKYIPSSRAEALVDYLLSRKKDAKIPAADKRNG